MEPDRDDNRPAQQVEQRVVTTPIEVAPVVRPVDTTPAPGAAPERTSGHEEVARIQVEPEDRLAFRVGVNILTLVLVGLAVYLVWRRFFAGG